VSSDPVPAYLRWALVRSALARGWWLVTALYLVLDARLSPTRLILVGVFQALAVLVAEVPAGVLADTVSRRLSVVGAQVVTGAGMAMTAFVTDFPLVVVTQCLWGAGWALASGADVAWITDELDDPGRIDRVLVAQARRELAGAVVGPVVLGTVAWVGGRGVAMAGAGAAMVLLGLSVARWPETGFVPVAAGRRWPAAVATLRAGGVLARSDRVVLGVLVATALINGGHEGFGRLLQRRILVLGLPAEPDPIVWFATLALVSAAAGAMVLRVVEPRIDGVGVASRSYLGAGAVGTVGLVVFAFAPGAAWAAVGAVLVAGIAFPTAGVAATVLVNRRTASAARATVHSLASQAENAGELVFGLALAAVAAATTGTVALLGSAGLVVAAGVVVGRTGQSGE
jgi:MFS family permease